MKEVYTDLEKQDSELAKAMEIVIREMKKDTSEGSYYYTWQANIAMAFYDEFHRELEKRTGFTRYLFIENGIHEIANNAAKSFLNLLIK
jgi:hypothetical protein